VTRRLRGPAAVVVVLVAGLLLAACGGGNPVHPGVEWEGRNAGPYEEDERVQVVRDYVLHMYAAHNALNYSEPELRHLAMLSHLKTAARDTANHAGSFYQSPWLWEGPPSFSVIEIVEDALYPDSEDIYNIVVCQKWAPRWSGEDERINPVEGEADSKELGGEDVTDLGDGLYRIEERGYRKAYYQVREWDGRWQVRGESGISANRGEQCEPEGDVAIGTYTTPPDLELLTAGSADIIGPERLPVDR
jgi:hypothetical protein